MTNILIKRAFKLIIIIIGKLIRWIMLQTIKISNILRRLERNILVIINNWVLLSHIKNLLLTKITIQMNILVTNTRLMGRYFKLFIIEVGIHSKYKKLYLLNQWSYFFISLAFFSLSWISPIKYSLIAIVSRNIQ